MPNSHPGAIYMSQLLMNITNGNWFYLFSELACSIVLDNIKISDDKYYSFIMDRSVHDSKRDIAKSQLKYCHILLSNWGWRIDWHWTWY